VSALERFPGYSEINSEISDLAVVISNKFTKADSQILLVSGGYRPIADLQLKEKYLRPTIHTMRDY
jgi:hypothetical protein